MTAPDSQHSRTRSLLLIAKLLDCRDNTSPFTLIIDSLEQSARPLIIEYIQRAKDLTFSVSVEARFQLEDIDRRKSSASAKSRIIFVSFSTFRSPTGIDVFIRAYDLSLAALQQEIKSAVSAQSARTLLVIDSLHTLASDPAINLASYLSTLLTPTTSLLAIYHSDQPLPPLPSYSLYAPKPLTLLKFLATTILTTHSLSHVLTEKAARDRSLAVPVFGLLEGEEGVLQSLGCNDTRGLVAEMEYRRKSGRSIETWFYMPSLVVGKLKRKDAPIMLLEDSSLYRHVGGQDTKAGAAPDGSMEHVSFKLGLTEKQKMVREGVVLPYTDAQRDGGGGEGGRILYDMGVEDDFDEEEDEI